MNSKYTIKNFRVFDAEGATFELAPITVLTGCNSSGKSSVVKSRILLSDYLKKVRHDYLNEKHCFLEDYKMDFTQLKHKLGSFDKTLNFKAKKGSKMSFKYSVKSLLLAEEIEIELSFRTKKNDELNNGWLSEITISGTNGDILFLAKVNKENKLEITQINLFRIKQNFIDFSVCACGLSSLERLSDLNNKRLMREEGLNDSEIETQRKEMEQQIDEFMKIKESMSEATIVACLKWYYNTNLYFKKNPYIDYISMDYEKWPLIKSVYENKTFFYMPLFDWVKDVPKDKVRFIIEEKIHQLEKVSIDDNKNDLGFHLNRILDNFEESDYERFIDYFLSFENNLSFSMYFGGKSFVEIAGDALRISTSDRTRVIPGTLVGKKNAEKGQTRFASDFWKTREIDFGMIYSILMTLCCRADADFEQRVYIKKPRIDEGCWGHEQYVLFRNYFESVLEELIIKAPENITDTEYVDSSRIDVQRLYTLEDKDKEFNKLLIEYFDAKRLYLKNKDKEWSFETVKIYDYEPNSFINHWVKEFNIGDSLEIKSIENGLGIIINLHKNEKTSLLSDEGYGITQVMSLFLRIEIAILKATRYKRMIIPKVESNKFSYYNPNIPYDGDEKSDFIELFYEPTTIFIEEPEIHLHPALQSKLAEMFLYAYKKYNIRFIVETHSEYLVRKLQTLVAKRELIPDDVSLFYLYDPNPEKRPVNTPQVKKINIKYDGRLDDTFGEGFFDEADNMAMDLLSIKSLSES